MGIRKRLTQSKEKKTYHTDILVALQAYEDTGMTPREIEKMRDNRENSKVVNSEHVPEPEKVKYALPGWFQKTMRQRRKCVGMSIEYLAKMCGTNFDTIRKMETEENFAVIEDLVYRVCSVLGLTASWEQLQSNAGTKEIKEG